MVGRTATAMAGLAVAALTGAAAYQAGSSDPEGGARSSLTLIAPASPGGGWDGLARTMQQVLRSEGIVASVQVVNIPGAGGTIGLAGLEDRRGDGQTLMITGLVMAGAVELNDSPVTFEDVTPVAMLTEDYEVMVVPADSEFEDLDGFMQAWKQDPGGTAIGGGSLGGTDQLVAGLLAQSGEIDPAELNYIAYPGGGEALASLLSGNVAAGFSGYAEFAPQIDAGKLRALGLSADEPVENVDVPVFPELGYEGAVLPNWRGVLAPRGLDSTESETIQEILDEMVATDAWAEALERNQWTDAYLTGEDFQAYVDTQSEDVIALLEKLGLL
ncbi:MAG: tripartite tricarboxylate transporter substrate binding protein [Ornithinimicrobium sp.]